MDPVKTSLNKTIKVPLRYNPHHLTQKDKKKQKRNLLKSRKLYKKGIYYIRPKVKSFKSKKSRHLQNLQTMYNVENANINEDLARKTQCKIEGLEEIMKKGQGAYYSSGSRPNQTAHSWGAARLASALTGGNASTIDYHVLEKYCATSSKPLKLAKKQCKKLNRTCKATK